MHAVLWITHTDAQLCVGKSFNRLKLKIKHIAPSTHIHLQSLTVHVWSTNVLRIRRTLRAEMKICATIRAWFMRFRCLTGPLETPLFPVYIISWSNSSKDDSYLGHIVFRLATCSLYCTSCLQARQVLQVFPHMPLNAVMEDLRVTRSVYFTIENILEGRLQAPLVGDGIC